MGRFDVKSRVERARRGPLPTEPIARYALHRKASAPWCACPFSERALVECLCCGKTLCFNCGGILNRQEVSEYLSSPAFDGELPFNDSLENL